MALTGLSMFPLVHEEVQPEYNVRPVLELSSQRIMSSAINPVLMWIEIGSELSVHNTPTVFP